MSQNLVDDINKYVVDYTGFDDNVMSKKNTFMTNNIGEFFDFIASFWRARIMTSPEDFVNYEFLASKGMKVIDEYEGKDNQANHTMFVVRHHLPYKVNLNVEQENWLDE